MHVATAHLGTREGAAPAEVLARARQVLADRHGVAHATLQVEPALGSGCEELGW
jgi:cobalt-zinc-cadmium efflux system protein